MKSLLKIAEFNVRYWWTVHRAGSILLRACSTAGHLGAVPAGDDHAVGGVALGRDRGLAVCVAGGLAVRPVLLGAVLLQPAPANIGEGGGGELQARGGEELLAHPVVDRPADPRGVARPVDGGVGLEGGVVSARVLYGLLDTATPRP